MTRRILTYPDNVLREKAKPVENIGGDMITLAHDMAETMYFSKGIGLAAPQVGEPCCLIIADVGEGLIEIFNPSIIVSEGLVCSKEGCLSVPEVTLEVKRAETIVLKGLNRDGKEITVEATDLKARVLQHEIDHLHGTLIIDRISMAQRQLISGKLRKLRREHSGT